MQSKSNQFQPDGRIPLVIGVTGHRRLAMPDATLEKRIRTEMRSLKTRFPHTPFWVATSMAEGADRLLARLAVEILDARLLVILPMPVDEYRRDFATTESQAEFNTWLAKADRVEVVPQKYSVEQVAQDTNARNHQYAWAGAWMAEQPQILFAIWDGKPARGLGGTGDVVQWRIQSTAPPDLTTLDESNLVSEDYCGLTCHFNPETNEVRHVAASRTPHEVLHLFAIIDKYNQDVLSCQQPGKNSKHSDPAWEAALEQIRPVQTKEQTAGMEAAHRCYEMADRLALRFQKIAHRLILVIAWCLFLALFWQQLAKADTQGGLLSLGGVIYIGFAVLFFATELACRWKRIEERYLEYRALAEGLRIAVAWRLGGVKKNVSACYRAEHVDAITWVREALHGLEASLWTSPSGGQGQPLLAPVKNWWIGSQTGYFRRKAAFFHRRGKIFDRIVLTCTMASIGLSAAGFLNDYWPIKWLAGHSILLSGIFLSAAAITKYYNQKKTYSALGNHFDLSAKLFDKAACTLGKTPEKSHQLLVELGRDIISENTSWLQANRRVPIKPN